jgi:hypothetical protein
MTTPDLAGPQNQDNPGNKMRSLLSSKPDDAGAPPAPRPLKELPRKPAAGPGSRAVLAGSQPQTQPKARGTRRVRIPFRRDKVAPAFWTVASVVSITVNVVMLIVVLALMRELNALNSLRNKVTSELIGGLHDSFVQMGMAHIATKIPVKLDNVPVNFILEYQADTVVELTQDTPIHANVTIQSGFITINGPANIVLDAGTELPIRLDLQIPVNTTVSIDQLMAIDIPLNVTDLDAPFKRLIAVIKPYHCLLEPQATLLLDDGTVMQLCEESPAQ